MNLQASTTNPAMKNPQSTPASGSRLTPDIVALIHQSELNRAGWLEQHKRRAITALFWLRNEPLSAEDIVSHQATVGLSGLAISEASDLLASLCADGSPSGAIR